MQFICRLGTPEGEILEEVHEASDERALREELAKKGVHLFEVRAKGVLGRLRIPSLRRANQRLPPRELMIFNQELAALIRSGLPMLQALNLILPRQRDPEFRNVVTQIRDKVSSGEDLSQAVSDFGELFPPLYSATLKAGERSGEMEQVIRRFVRHLGLILETRKRIASALVYPVTLIGLSFGLILVMTVFVLPKFTDFFSNLQVELPLLTRITMGFSLFVKENIFVILFVLGGAGLALTQFARSVKGGMAIARWKLRVPFLGHVFHQSAISEFCRSLSTLLAGGIPLVTSLEVAVRAISNPYLKSKLEPVIQRVNEGQPLAETLDATGVTSDIVIDMVQVGEATGELDAMLSDLSDFLDEEVEVRLDRALSLLEPVMLVLMGFIVATLLISVYLPLFSLLGQIEG
jgi:type IV pilus assembly protein PilC